MKIRHGQVKPKQANMPTQLKHEFVELQNMAEKMRHIGTFACRHLGLESECKRTNHTAS